jgi:tryptophan halogenase
MQINNIAIVGGGTAGLITALILRKSHPTLEIDLIESDKIGIVGVGEGSTEHWAQFMSQCDISLSSLIKETDATFKYGIKFDNWNGDNSFYIHSVSSSFNVECQTHSKFIYSWLIANDAGPNDLTHKYIERNQHREPFWSINQFHFNTVKLNDFLHRLCEERNIKIIKAEIDDVVVNEQGFVTTLVDSQKNYLTYDFYIDSTGFHRLILEKKLKVKWISYQKYLPMNSAIAFPTERTEDIPSWTLAKSMNSGWLWRIPTQERYGNGYVFNDQFCDFDKAQEEVEALYGHSVNIAKKIKFDAGRLDKSWVNNVAAIGLSSSFIEPLEASSIGSSIQQAFLFSDLLASYSPTTKYSENTFNLECEHLLENILDFVALHYKVKRNDTEFWKQVKDIPTPPGLEEKLEIFKSKMPTSGDFVNRRVMFKEANWIMVMHGQGLISRETAYRDVERLPPHIRESVSFNINNIVASSETDKLFTHRHAIQWLIDNPETL